MTPAQRLSIAFLAISDPHRGTAPYLGSALAALIRVSNSSIKTLAVSDRGVLYYNPAFVESLSREMLASCLEHEVYHVLWAHAARAKDLGVTPEKHEIANVAQDMAINEALLAAGRKLPDFVATPEKYQQAPNLIWEERYHLLLKNAVKVNVAGICAGSCGSCATGQLDKATVPGRSSADMHRIRCQTAEAIRDHAKQRGTIPAGLLRWADEILGPAKIDWRQKLARVLREAVAYRKGHTDLGWRCPSRRQAGLGYGPGHAVLPSFITPIVTATAIIDTSGSMGPADFSSAMAEIDGILKALGTNMDLCTCDAAVHEFQEISCWKDALPLLKGGGGTDMRPAFEAILARPKKPNIIICITDGYLGSGVPEYEPAGVTVVWILVGKQHGTPCTWGEQIEVDA